jgi:hypothetical protein
MRGWSAGKPGIGSNMRPFGRLGRRGVVVRGWRRGRGLFAVCMGVMIALVGVLVGAYRGLADKRCCIFERGG